MSRPMASALGLLLLSSCATTSVPVPAVPDPEVLFAGLALGGVVLLPPPEERVELIERSSLTRPTYKRGKRAKPSLPAGSSPDTTSPKALLHLVQYASGSPEPESRAEDGSSPLPRRAPKPENRDQVIKTTLVASLVAPSKSATTAGSGIMVYPWEAGKQYPLITSPNYPSIIKLPPREELAGDLIYNNKEWAMGLAEGGEGKRYQQTIIVRAAEPGLKARLPLPTKSGREYFVLLESTASVSQVGLTWTLPTVAREEDGDDEDDLTGPPGGRGVPRPKAPAPAPVPKVDVTRVHTAWKIESVHGAAPWVPLSVWDDGQKIVVQFKSSLGYTYAPGVFAINNEGKPVMIDSKSWEDGDPRHPSYYIVNGLYPVLLLKDGQGNDVKLTRITGQAEPYREVTRAPARS